MDLVIINKALADRKDIFNEQILKEKFYQDNKYEILIKCDIVILTFTIPMITSY